MKWLHRTDYVNVTYTVLDDLNWVLKLLLLWFQMFSFKANSIWSASFKNAKLVLEATHYHRVRYVENTLKHKYYGCNTEHYLSDKTPKLSNQCTSKLTKKWNETNKQRRLYDWENTKRLEIGLLNECLATKRQKHCSPFETVPHSSHRLTPSKRLHFVWCGSNVCVLS